MLLESLRTGLVFRTRFLIVLGMIASFALNFLYQNGRLLGQRVLFNFITGQYHRPRIETRIVLFLDLAGSSGIAERIGDRQYLRFLERFFLDMTPAILDNGAEIYKYVGDEVFLAAIEKSQAEYRDEFAAVCSVDTGRNFRNFSE